MPNTLSKREKILNTASQIFYKEGYKITGVDRIARAAGITKATLYHYFQNKDQLIEESLRLLSQTFKEKCQEAWQKPNITPEEKLSVLFEALHAFFSQDDCYGCPFIKATSEYEDPGHVIRQISKIHSDFIIEELERFAKDAKLRESRHVAEQIFIAIMGAYSGWYVGGLTQAALQAKRMTRLVIEAHRAP
jgi:AcrR family transcriptional regulator